ncbi:MAG TPA: 4Fe-4S dicluster domain-containing protein, partial [Blastocatellia bacterium]|nr:4Fe-4S dicluster domain-containing protein [Blastocatellia bacterium]
MAAVAQTSQTHGTLATLLEANLDKLLTCVHCGLCLPACPTYRALGDENDSPRGRVYLMRGVVEGKLALGDAFISHIDLCLGCRGCESVCPSGVPYGHLLEAARVEVANAKADRGFVSEKAIRFVLSQVFTRPWLLRSTLALARWFRDSGFAKLVFKSRLVGGRGRFALALLLASRPAIARRKGRSDEQPGKEHDLRVAVLRGCVMEGLFRETNRATERVLACNGCRLVEANRQMCCGALHAHAGQLKVAKQL